MPKKVRYDVYFNLDVLSEDGFSNKELKAVVKSIRETLSNFGDIAIYLQEQGETVEYVYPCHIKKIKVMR